MGWKRLSIVTWVLVYIGAVGVPVWWKTTSVERPVFKPNTRAFFQSIATSSKGLPITFHVTLITHDLSDGPEKTRGNSSASGNGTEDDQSCPSSQHLASRGIDVEALRLQLQEELQAAAQSEHMAPPPGPGTNRSGADVTEVHVDTIHLTRTTCASPQQMASSSAPSCSGSTAAPSAVPCAAMRFIAAPPPSSAAEAWSPQHATEAAAHVRRLERAMASPSAAQHSAQTCPGTHRILLIVGSGHCTARGDECGQPDPEVPSAWIGTARASYVWLSNTDAQSGAQHAAAGIFRVVMHGLRAWDARPMHTPLESGASWAGGPGRDAEGSSQRKVPLSAASELSAVFTLAVAEPEVGNLPDNIGRDLEVAWGALVERLHPLAHIRLESQVRLYARARLVDVTSQRAALGVTVPPKALPFFVDTDAWSLEHGRMVAGHAHPLSADPHGIPESILHFVGYMPASEERPMRIQCGRGDCAGFKIADWGGVTLLNSRHVQSDLPLFLGTSIQQFRELLGLAPAGNWVVAAPRGVAGNRSQGRRSHHVRGGLGAVAVLSPEGDGVALWEVDWLMRHRYLQLLHETSSAVAALLDLVSTLDSLEIPAFIGSKVDNATLHVLQAAHAGEEGDYQFAMQQARAGRVDAEVALTHHAIASQHNYPFQHKIAVYLPLFAPLSLPIVAAAFVEFKRRIRRPAD